MTEAEKTSAKLLGEAAATSVALDALENLYASVSLSCDNYTQDLIKSIEEARQVLYFAGRLAEKE